MKLESIICPEPTQEMYNRYKERTNSHIGRVIKNMVKVAPSLLDRAKHHDESKYGIDEYIPYVWLTEYHRCKKNDIDFKYPPNVEDAIDMAVKHHYSTNRHHPEFHEKPSDMSNRDIIEMVCDWTAMSQEFGDDVTEWADKCIKDKYEFTTRQIKLIYGTIESLV